MVALQALKTSIGKSVDRTMGQERGRGEEREAGERNEHDNAKVRKSRAATLCLVQS